MKIYIDINNGFKCFTTDTGGLLEYEEPFFNSKCPEFIESYLCKPVGYEWTDENGEAIRTDCKLVTPWKDLSEAYAAQAAYLEQLLAAAQAQTTDMQAALEVLGVTE